MQLELINYFVNCTEQHLRIIFLLLNLIVCVLCDVFNLKFVKKKRKKRKKEFQVLF